MALFMGSDYTPGVKGIAAVNAIEIISCFGSTEQDLQKFREWVSVEKQIVDQATYVKPTKQQLLIEEIEDAMKEQRDQTQIERDFLRKHRNFRKHWVFPLDFPNFEVVKAYRNPPVNENLNKFGWGEPDFV